MPRAGARRVVNSDDDDSGLPSWLGKAAAPAGGVLAALSASESDSDVKEVMSPPATGPASQKQQQQQQQQQQRTGEDAAQQRQPRGVGAPRPKAVPVSQPPSSQPPEGTQPQTQTQPQTEDERAAPPTGQRHGAQPRSGPGIHAAAREMVVVLPEKLGQTKLLVELEAGGDAHGATDLSGDSGAIGRLLVRGPAAEPELQLDLKGVLYTATVVPCPVTLAIVHMGASEAKVEALLSEFVQLRALADTAALDFGEDQEEDEGEYVEGLGGQGGQGDDGGAKHKKKGARGKKAGGAAAKGGGGSSKRGGAGAKPRAGGVKKPKAAGKGKPKPKAKPATAGGGAKKAKK
eukprot:scaffold4.g4893.t1